MREQRVLQNGDVVSFEGKRYCLEPNADQVIPSKFIEVRKYRNGELAFVSAGIKLKIRDLESTKKAA